VEFTADPENITAGESSTLTWKTKDAQRVVIEPKLGEVNVNGSRDVSPDQDTTYTLTAYSKDNSTSEAEVSINVNHTPEAHSQTVTTKQGKETSITLNASDPDNDELSYSLQSDSQHGSLSGTPPDLTYTPDSGYTGSDSFEFTVSDGEAESDPATVRIEIEEIQPQEPEASLSLNPEKVDKGGSATLDWDTQGASKVSIDQGVGSVAISGSTEVSPNSTTTYTLTATNKNGSASAEATLKVLGDPKPQPEGSFGEQYQDQIPKDATVEEYDTNRFALITGKVENSQGDPIENVRIRILDHPEY